MQITQQPTLRIGHVSLVVQDLEAASAFYRDVIGLEALDGDGKQRRFSSGGEALLLLRGDRAAARSTPAEAGLFHTAFLLPSRADLGRWIAHAAGKGVRFAGASDHGVSEAVYLSDPEGNGVEVYADRPRAQWRGDEGGIAMYTARLDLDDVVQSGAGAPWAGTPPATTLGHVHLQVGSIGRAERFYHDLLGIPVQARMAGATFYGSGGYHHHVATNTWNSAGARTRPLHASGLDEVGMQVVDAAELEAIGRRAAQVGVAATTDGTGLLLSDPWGTLIRLAVDIH